MIDFEAKLERFETLAAECDLISKLSGGHGRSASYICASASITANWLTTCGR